MFRRDEVFKTAERRKLEIQNFCNVLIKLDPKISQFTKVLEFHLPKPEDLNVPHNARLAVVATLQFVIFISE